MERSVIIAAAQGDVRAFREIFDHYLPKMRPVCLRYVRTLAEADDILQDSFVKIFHSLSQYKFEGSFEGWVRRIVVNTALNHHKKNKMFYAHENVEDLNDEEVGGDEAIEVEEAEPSVLLNVIGELPEGYKIVFNLYVMEGFSHKEIAEQLGISEGTSRSQYAKAKKMIKKMLYRQRNAIENNLIKKNLSE